MKKPGQTASTCRSHEKSHACGCKKKQHQANPAHVMQEIAKESHSDVLGSYTGTPADGGQPQQDADDL